MTEDLLQYEDIQFCVHGNMRIFSRMLKQYYDAALAPSGILITQFMVMGAIAIMEETTIQPLAEVLKMDRTTLTRALKPLERDNLVEINLGEDDARKRLIRLTDTGNIVMQEAYPLWKEAQTSVIANLGEERWMQIYQDMHNLLSELQADT